MKKRILFSLGCGMAVALALGLSIGVSQTRAQPDETKTKEGTKGKRAEEFIAAFNRGDAKALATLWTEDGRYVDPNGVEVKGREALEKMYEALFAEM
jgi:hypothetical protein